jgi:DNA-binding XRE family transcriptional regulator
MKKILQNVTQLTTKVEYELLTAHLDNLIDEATKGGHLANPDAENEYTAEIARLSTLGGNYETQFMSFSFNTPKSPLVLGVQREMAERGMKQKEAASFLGIQEPAFSRFMCGKMKPSYDLAKRLYQKFNIRPDLIFSE